VCVCVCVCVLYILLGSGEYHLHAILRMSPINTVANTGLYLARYQLYYLYVCDFHGVSLIPVLPSLI